MSLFSIQKRSDERSNEVRQIGSSLMSYSVGDRFIPYRGYPVFHATEREERQVYHFSEKVKEFDIFTVKANPCYWKKAIYRKYLSEALGITDLRNVYSYRIGDNLQESMKAQPYNDQDWKCNHRNKSCVSLISLHDLPGFKHFYHRNILEWTSNNELIVCIGSHLCIWHMDSNSTTMYDVPYVYEIALSADNKEIAQSTDDSIIFWNVENSARGIRSSRLPIKCKASPLCIRWTNDNKYIIIGFINGSIAIADLAKMNSEIKPIKAHRSPIKNISLSCNNQYLSSIDHENNVIIWRITHNYVQPFIKLLQLNHSDTVQQVFVSWHPWEETEFILAISNPAIIKLYNLASKSCVSYYERSDNRITIDCISFNKISAELVVGYSTGRFRKETHEVLVLAAINQVVDVLNEHRAAVKALVWNHEGTKLATVGYDEILILSHFLDKSKFPNMKEVKNKSLFSQLSTQIR